MKTLHRQELDVVNKTWSNPESFRGWRGQFTPDSKPIEFERFGNCGEFAIIERWRAVPGFISLEFEGITNRGNKAAPLIPSNSTDLQHPPKSFGGFGGIGVAEGELVLCEE
jgi:hypothetical protein